MSQASHVARCPEPRARVLVVDDDEGMLALVSAALRPLGLRVETTDNGSSALARLAAAKFDLVVSDLSMPGVDGGEVLEVMRARGDRTPVLFLSAEGTVPAVVRIMKCGACGFLQKPVELKELKREVLAALRAAVERPELPTARLPHNTDVDLDVRVDVPRASTPTLARPRDTEAPTGRFRRSSAEDRVTPDGPDGALVARLGRYVIGPEVAVGGMGRVHRGYDPTLGRTVAVKILTQPRSPALRDELLLRFRSERVALAKLRHPHIVALYDCGVDPATELPSLVMEPVEGRSLGDLLGRDGPLDLDLGLRLSVQLARALAYAHGQGVVHRDVKPDNVIVGPDEHAWLIDFGLARLENLSLTAARVLVGTPSYVAPETVAGRPLDWRADQFSLATTMIEMLTGKNVFRGDSLTETLGLVAFETTPALEELGLLGAPPLLSSTLLRMHAKEPSARFQDERELLDTLLRVLASIGDASGPRDRLRLPPWFNRCRGLRRRRRCRPRGLPS